MRAVGIGGLGKLLVVYPLGEEVAYVELQFPVAAPLLAYREVDGVAWHLVAVRHTCVVVACRAALAAAYTDDALAYAVVEKGYVELHGLVLVEQTGVDKVRRLALHWSVFFL